MSIPIFGYSQSKQELLNEVNASIDNIKNVIKLSEIRIEVGTVIDNQFDPKDETNFESSNFGSSSEKTLQTYFDNLEINTILIYPFNYIKLELDDTRLSEILGKDHFYYYHNPEELPVITPQKVIYLDSTYENVAESFIGMKQIMSKFSYKVDEYGYSYLDEDTAKLSYIEKYVYENKSGFYESFVVPSSKPISQIEFDFALPLHNQTTYTLSNFNKKCKTPYGEIIIDTIVGNELYCTMPSKLYENVMLHAIYKDKRVLNELSSSYFTKKSDKQKNYYYKLLSVTEKAKAMILSFEIKNENELENYINNNTSTEFNEISDESEPQLLDVKYKFSGPIHKVNFIVSDSTIKTTNYHCTYKLEYRACEKNYLVAADLMNSKTGIIDKNGNWVVPPTFDRHFRPLNEYFYWDQIDDYEATYWFDHKTEKLHKVDYRIDDSEIYNEKYVKIEKEYSGLDGLADVTTGKIVLPTEYTFIQLKENKYWLCGQNNLEGVYDANFKQILPIEFTDIEIHKDFFYVRTPNNEKSVYNAEGKLITLYRLDHIYDYFEDGLLLVYLNDIPIGNNKTDNSNSRYCFIDTNGNIKIDLEQLHIESAESFSDGLSAVRNTDGDYGYIDTIGKVVIPYMFETAHSFYPTSKFAYVELKDGTDALIDKRGNVVKIFNGNIISWHANKGDRNSRLVTYSGFVYNEYGEAVKEK